MADSPLHSLASLRSSAVTFGSDSRPASRARSDTSFVTARPGSSTSTRTIGQEIDHIKTLISRSTDPPRTPSGSISAQVFRPRSSSISFVTQAHVLHELDHLKRRIIQEQQRQQQQYPQLTRRISQVDPGQESDSDHEDVHDEREVELERAREETIVIRQRLDGLLETAERKIDQLTADKQRLEIACEQRKEGLVVAALERRNLTHALDVAQSRIEQLVQELRQVQKEQQIQLSELDGNTAKSDAAHADELQEQVMLLQSRNAQLEMDLSAAQGEARKTWEQLESLEQERVASESLSKEAIAVLQERLDLEVARVEGQGNEIEGLRSNLAHAEAAISLASSANAEQCAQLRNQIEQSKSRLQDALQAVSASHAAHQEMTQSRDQLASERDGYQVKLEAALLQQARTEEQLIEHEEALEKVRAACRSEVEQIRREATRDASNSRQHHTRTIDDLNTKHDEALQALEDLKASHQAEVARQIREAAEVHAKVTNELHSHHQRALESMTAENQSAISRLQAEHQQRVDKLEAEWAQKAADAIEAHTADLQNAADEAAKTERESLKAELSATKQRLLAEHGRQVARLRSEYDTQLEAAEAKMRTAAEDHQRATAELRTTHVADLQRLRSKHDRDTRERQSKSNAKMDLLRKDSVEVLSRVTAIEAGYDAQMKDLRISHDAELTILKNELAAYVEDIKMRSQEASVMKREIEGLRTRLEEARFEAEERAFASERQHEAALHAAVERIRQSGEAQLRNLKKRHQDAVSEIRATAQKQTAIQLTDLEKLHQQEFANFRTSTLESHQGDVMRLETEHQSRLAEVEGRLQDQRAAELAAKQATYLTEMKALQARVDASLTGQAEAERAVALLRQQVVKTDRRSLESKASAEDRVASLRKENDDLTEQLTLVQCSLRDSQRKAGSDPSTPSSDYGHSELMKLQLANFEEERLAMRRTLEKRSAEKAELARQNDFLVKELDALLAQRSRTKKTASQMVDAVVQTESFISEPKVDLSSIQLLKAESRTSMALSRPGQRSAEQFPALTRGYGHKVADLLDNKSRLEGDLSISPTQFEQDMGELQTKSARLAERSGGGDDIQRYARAGPSPNHPAAQGLKAPSVRRRSPTTSLAGGDRSRQLTRTSTPRTSLSIPRSASHARNGLQATLPSPRGAEKHPPVPQLSLMRAKTPSDVHSVAARAVSSPLMTASPVLPPSSPSLRRASQQIYPQPPPRLSGRGQGDTAHDLSIEPSAFEEGQFQRHSSYVNGAAKPNVTEPSKPGFLRRVVDKISPDSSRPVSSSSAPPHATALGHRARSKSTKLSSGMIYYQAPKRTPSPKSHDP